jgi:uncharacterized protein (DUF488 family)
MMMATATSLWPQSSASSLFEATKFMRRVVFTIGHSTHPLDRFMALLKQHNITALCDIRSRPYSRINPQFNRENLKKSLREQGIVYVFLGKELGAQSEDASCYLLGKVQYDRLAKTNLFRKGLDRVREGMKGYRLALMCAEKDPLECHRSILVARHLEALHTMVEHILDDGSLESHGKALNRLLRQLQLPEQDLFRSREDMIEEAYRIQSERIAYDEGEASSDSEPIRSIYR